MPITLGAPNKGAGWNKRARGESILSGGFAIAAVVNPGAPYGVRPVRPRSYLDFEKLKVAAAAAARHHYRGLIWLGLACRAGGAPSIVLQI